ncbi:MAG: methyltransferase domain-containing protein [Paracoccaceae bacterium]|nr:methyltransferase domain-containing protein [Paracoccaceae bacterium]
MKSNKDYWKTQDYTLHANFVSALAQEVMQDLAPQRGEKILDIGCGDGELGTFIMEQGATVLGIDSSANFVEAARRRGVNARIEDAQNIQFENEFDAVFSNAALHWMLRQEELMTRVFHALRSGGRFVVEMGGNGNISLICRTLTEILAEYGIDFAARNPWVFPTPDEQRKRLEKAGFKVIKCSLRKRPTPLPTNVRGWFDTFCNEILVDLSDSDRDEILGSMVEKLRPLICGPDGTWTVDYVRLNFVAIKP